MYAGFICGMMGSSRSGAIAHTALMNEQESRTHPSRARRVEATLRGWLRAQHIRRIVQPGQICPLFRFSGEGMEQRVYEGTLGDSAVTVHLAKSAEGTVFGRYEVAMDGGLKEFRCVGRANEALDCIELEEYFGCEPTAKVGLVRQPGTSVERWTGTMVSRSGEERAIDVSRRLEPVMEEDVPEASAGGEILTPTVLAGFSKRWLAIASLDEGQMGVLARRSENFPFAWVEAKKPDGYRVSAVAGDANGWALLLARDTGFGDQKILGPGPVDETRFAELSRNGYRITSVAGFGDTWVMVLSRGSGLGRQRFIAAGRFSEPWIRDRFAEGYRITSLAGDDDGETGSWTVVMSRDSALGEQVFSDGNGFPAGWIEARWGEGYRITAASGFDGWRVIMSKDSGLGRQVYQEPSGVFPIAQPD